MRKFMRPLNEENVVMNIGMNSFVALMHGLMKCALIHSLFSSV